MSTVQIKIGPADHGRRMSLAEFLDAEETPGFLYELARGVIEVSDVPGDPRAQVVDNLHEQVSGYRRDHPGRILRIGHGSDIQIVLPDLGSDRHPDLGVVLVGKAPDADGRRMPDLVVEVVSPGRRARDRDYVDKREEYLKFGITEYWIVDRFLRQVTVLMRREATGDATWDERVFSGDDAIDGEVLPGFVGAVSGLWAGVEDED